MSRALLQPRGSSSLPSRTCITACPAIPPHPAPDNVPLGPTRQHPLIVQMGKLKSRENGAAQATQQVSSRVTTETQPRFYSASPLPATSAPPPFITAGVSMPSRAEGKALGCSPAHVGYTQDPGGHMGTRNSPWPGGRTWLLFPAVPWIMSKRPWPAPCPLRASVSPSVKHEVKYSCSCHTFWGRTPKQLQELPPWSM